MITSASEYAPYLPPPQSAQVEAEVAPTAAENLPALQSLQTDAPAAEYLPAASQLVQMVDAAIYTHTLSPQLCASFYISIYQNDLTTTLCKYLHLYIPK